ncbi:MAG TPA: rhodanese-like domain-containing protein, partial [Bacteroidales bacterium]|nr:rhodanese-like domain-containing protein [Bacteroidales bacterium]
MKTKNLLLLALLAVFALVTSCNKDDDDPQPEINEAEVLVKYLESADSPLGKDYVNTDMPSIMPASEVKTLNETGQVYIMDIRSAADYAAGHIENAVNVELKNILTHLEGVNLTNYTKIAVVCYTGQTAGFATSILRLMGYDKAFSMKWGMCSWNAFFSSRWDNAVANGNAYAAQFTATAAAKGAKGDLPELSTGKTTGQEILEARVNTLLNEGFTPATVTNATVFGALTSYYIVNYWPLNHYENPGHIPGAIQYTPKETIKLSADLKTLPTDKPVVVYCYTGQT